MKASPAQPAGNPVRALAQVGRHLGGAEISLGPQSSNADSSAGSRRFLVGAVQSHLDLDTQSADARGGQRREVQRIDRTHLFS